jgi:uncharacterized protein (TIGR00251 family)
MIATIPHSAGVVVPVLAHPGSKRDEVLGERAGALRVAVTAAPEKGKANLAIQSVLARALACKAQQITLLSGETSRQKRFLIQGVNREDLQQRLAVLVTENASSPTIADRSRRN